MAYRGRVFVEIETKLNASSTSETDSINQTDVIKVQVSSLIFLLFNLAARLLLSVTSALLKTNIYMVNLNIPEQIFYTQTCKCIT